MLFIFQCFASVVQDIEMDDEEGGLREDWGCLAMLSTRQMTCRTSGQYVNIICCMEDMCNAELHPQLLRPEVAKTREWQRIYNCHT